jgi:hypothetical protein
MSSESVCQVARRWVEVCSFHTRLVEMFMIFTASVRNILDTPSYIRPLQLHFFFCMYPTNVLLVSINEQKERRRIFKFSTERL